MSNPKNSEGRESRSVEIASRLATLALWQDTLDPSVPGNSQPLHNVALHSHLSTSHPYTPQIPTIPPHATVPSYPADNVVTQPDRVEAESEDLLVVQIPNQSQLIPPTVFTPGRAAAVSEALYHGAKRWEELKKTLETQTRGNRHIPSFSVPTDNVITPRGIQPDRRRAKVIHQAYRDLLERGQSDDYRNYVDYPQRLKSKEVAIKGVENLFADANEERLAWQRIVAAVHLDNTQASYFMMAYPQHPLSLTRLHKIPLPFFETDFVEGHSTGKKVNFTRLLLVIEYMAQLYQNREALETFADYNPLAPEADQLQQLDECLLRLGKLYSKSLSHAQDSVTFEDVVNYNSFAVNIPDIIQWMYKRLFTSSKKFFFNTSNGGQGEFDYDTIFRQARKVELQPKSARNDGFWLGEANLVGKTVDSVVDHCDRLENDKHRGLSRTPRPFIHRDSLNKAPPPNRFNVIHIGDGNMAFISSHFGLNQSAITTPQMTPFEAISVLLRTDINFAMVHAVHLQFGLHELVSIPADLVPANPNYSDQLRELRIKQILDMTKPLSLQIFATLEAAHRLLATMEVPVLLLSTWQPYGVIDDLHTKNVKKAIDAVIIEVNKTIRDYANRPLPLSTVVFVVDIWQTFAQTILSPDSIAAQTRVLKDLYNLDSQNHYGIRVTKEGMKIWAEEFEICRDLALNSFPAHYEQWRLDHFDDLIYKRGSRVGANAEDSSPETATFQTPGSSEHIRTAAAASFGQNSSPQRRN